MNTQVEVWAVEKNIFHHVFLTSFCVECGESRSIIYFHRVLSILTKKEDSSRVEVSPLKIATDVRFAVNLTKKCKICIQCDECGEKNF